MPAPVFIGGTGRSGTTLVTRLLGRHPQLHALRHESRFLVSRHGLLELDAGGYSRRRLEAFERGLRGPWWRRQLADGTAVGLFRDLEEGERDAALAWLMEQARHQRSRRRRAMAGALRGTRRAVGWLSSRDLLPERIHGSWRRAVRAASPGGPASPELVAGFTERLFQGAVARAGATRWAEKTPRNLVAAAALARAFPDLRFVHVVRDGRDVALSMVQRQIWPTMLGIEEHRIGGQQVGTVTLDGAARLWRASLELGIAALAEVPRGQVIEVRLEDLVAEPRVVLERLCAFLGLPWHDELLAGIDHARVGAWREALDPADGLALTARLRPMLDRYGYP